MRIKSSCGAFVRNFFILISLLSCVNLGLSYQVCAASSPRVAIAQVAPHPALDKTRQGIVDALKKRGLTDEEILCENGYGSIPTSVQIAKKFASVQPEVVVAISTPSAQTLIQTLQNTPLVFAAVSDPARAGLMTPELQARVTGLIDLPPLEDQLAFYKKLFPHAKNVGVLFNPGEVNSESFVSALRQKTAEFGWTLKETTITRASDVSAAMQYLLAEGIELLILPQDNVVVLGIDAIAKLAFQAKVPVVGSDTDLVERGIFAAMGFSHYDEGCEAGEMVWQILNGASPSDLPVRPAGKIERLMNRAFAEQLGYEVPADLRGEIAWVESPAK